MNSRVVLALSTLFRSDCSVLIAQSHETIISSLIRIEVIVGHGLMYVFRVHAKKIDHLRARQRE